MSTKANFKTLQGLIGYGPLEAAFSVSKQTIDRWRQNRGFPYVLIPGDDRGSVRFSPAAVRSWAIAEGYTVAAEQIPEHGRLCLK